MGTQSPSDYKGWTPDTTDADAVASFREKYPDAAEVEIHRDRASVQVREATDGGQIGLGDNEDVLGGSDSGVLPVDDGAGIGEVTE